MSFGTFAPVACTPGTGAWEMAMRRHRSRPILQPLRTMIRSAIGEPGRPLTARWRSAAPDVARGVRAAFVTLVPFYGAIALARSELSWMALGGWFGTLADPGGPRARRARVLVTFVVMGCPLVFLFEELSRWRWLATAALMALAFAMSLLRAVGGSAGTLGTFLTIIAAIASGRTTISGADAVYWALGGTLALVVSSIVWPVWTHLPIRRAVALIYEELASYLEDAERASRTTGGRDGNWTDLVRTHHRRIRAALEAAREAALAGRARRQGETQFGGTIRALLGAAEVQFPLLASLVVEIESREPPLGLEMTRLKELAATNRAVAAVLSSSDFRGPAARLRQIPRRPQTAATSLAERLAARSEEAADLAVDWVRSLAGVRNASASVPRLPPGTPTALTAVVGVGTFDGERGVPALRARVRALCDALSGNSPFAEHALRVSLASGAASLIGDVVSPSRVYWVTVTTLAILQPYPGATVKRASERVVGTVLGCVLALLITTTVRSPIALTILLVPLSVAAVATRPRSYRLFTFFLTPVFVLVTGHAHDWHAAALRASDAILGGAVAFVAGVLVAPSSERQRLPDALSEALSCLSRYASAVLGSLSTDHRPRGNERTDSPRRATGVALGAAETALERLLAEPLGDRSYAADAMLLLTYARRLGTALTSIDVLAQSDPRGAATAGADVVGDYLSAVLRTAATFAIHGRSPSDTHTPLPPTPPGIGAMLERVVRWAALIAGVVEHRRPGINQ